MESIYKLTGYTQDGRMPIGDLYYNFLRLNGKNNWIKETTYVKEIQENGKKISLPVLMFRTKRQGPALWLISGIHGEEPAGPIALSRRINFINKLSRSGIPIVLIPLSNPAGYYRNWRYLNCPRICDNVQSIGDADHFLLNKKRDGPRAKKPKSNDCFIFTKHILKTTEKYPPSLIIDFHEDDITYETNEGLKNPLNLTYIYSQGFLGYNDPIAKEIVNVLLKNRNKLVMSKHAKTRFGEKIIKGIVSKVRDGSVDELLSTKQIFFNNKIILGPRAKSVIVVETTITNPKKDIEKRVKIHQEIIDSLKEFWIMVNKGKRRK